MATHLSQKEFAEAALATAERQDAHLETCHTCQSVLELFGSARSAAKGASPSGAALSEYEVIENIERLYSGGMAGQEAADYFQALVSSPKHFQVVFDFVAGSLQPVTEAEQTELAAYDHLSFAEEVIRRTYPAGPKKTPLEPEPAPIGTGERKSVSDWLLGLFDRYVPHVPAPVWAPALVLIVGLGVFGGFRFYNTSYKIYLAQETLRDSQRIYQENPQLSGPYGLSAIGQLMGPEDEKPLELARRFFDEAVASGSRSPKAAQVLAHIFVFEREYAKADSVLDALDTRAKKSPEILNDMGVIKHMQKDWRQAVTFFREAIEADPKYKQAYFNLALSQLELRQKAEALANIEKYLEMEKEDSWRSAALLAKQRIEKL